MAEHMRRAFEELLEGLARRRPLVVVLEDLHWGDEASVSLLAGALSACAGVPMIVIALARPEIVQVFPRLWCEADVHGLHLGALKRKASARLVHAVLGEGRGPDTVARIVTQAGGNAYYLEELIRHVAAGGGERFPETVLAVAQARLDGLDSEARRALRAGAIFGAAFGEQGLRRLLGEGATEAEVAATLDDLVAREILEPTAAGRHAGEREFAFRHDILRDAAYCTLTEGDRQLGHHLAAEWLEERGAPNALAVAEHWVAAGERGPAAKHFLTAGRQAAAAGNLDAAYAFAVRGLGSSAAGELRGELLLIKAYCHAFREELPETASTAGEALGLLSKGSTSWFRALAGLAGAATWGGNAMALVQALQALQSFDGAVAAAGPAGYAGNLLHEALLHIGQRAQASRLAERLSEAYAGSDEIDPAFAGWVELTRASRASLGLAPIGLLTTCVATARQRFEEANDLAAALTADAVDGYACIQLGRFEAAVTRCRSTVEAATTRGLPAPAGFATLFLGFALSLAGRPEEAIAALDPLLSGTNPLVTAYAKAELVLALLTAGRLDEALRTGADAVKASGLFPIANAHALAQLAAVELRLGRPDEALARIDAAYQRIARNAVDQVAESFLRVTHIEALLAKGEREAARGALGEAVARLERQAATIADAAARADYRTAVPPNARTFALARELL
jgi:hypothetical protein